MVNVCVYVRNIYHLVWIVKLDSVNVMQNSEYVCVKILLDIDSH